MYKFWNWTKNEDKEGRTLYINGVIASESWFDDAVTPEIFRNELFSGTGEVTLWINSGGGDCIAAAQIYNMLMDYKDDVIVKIDGIAASAASVIAMAGTRVCMSPVSMMMIHNPSTFACGESKDMKKVIDMLETVKESIINAYEIKTNLSREEISTMMDNETWMDYRQAVNYGFADGMTSERLTGFEEMPKNEVMYQKMVVQNSLQQKIAEKCKIHAPKDKMKDEPQGYQVSDLENRLKLMERHI